MLGLVFKNLIRIIIFVMLLKSKLSKPKKNHTHKQTYTNKTIYTQDGILMCEVDLNQIEVVKHSWGFKMTGRHAMYAKHLTEYVKDGYKQQILTDPALSYDEATDKETKHSSDSDTVPAHETRNHGL